MAHHLVIQLARFGDVVQTKRLLLSLAANPDDTVHLAVDVSLVPLARQIYPFAVVHALPAHRGGNAVGDVLLQAREAFAALAAIPFDSVYNLNFSGMSLALAGLFDPDAVRGYLRRNGQVLRSRWLRMAFRWIGNRHIAPLNLVDLWAYLHPSPVAPDLVNPAAAVKASGKIAVAASGREARRSLPPEVLAPVLEAIFAADQGPEIVLLGGNAERPFARKLARLLRPATVQRLNDLCGQTSLADLPDILSGCGKVLTPDTGIMHLAAHCGVPVQAFFLSSAWCFETGPYGAGHTVYQAVRECAPCVESRPCPFDTACLSPFASGDFAKSVAGREPRALPEGLVLFHSDCDAFGCDYLPCEGVLPEMKQRGELRALLAEYVGRAEERPDVGRFADAVFHETDWMLPPEGAGLDVSG